MLSTVDSQQDNLHEISEQLGEKEKILTSLQRGKQNKHVLCKGSGIRMGSGIRDSGLASTFTFLKEM